MRKLVVSEFVSLDGVMEDPRWTFQFESEERDKFKFDELAASDALLLGRVTYEGFAAAWPQMEEQTGEYGVWMNGYPKYVVSTTLERDGVWKLWRESPGFSQRFTGTFGDDGNTITGFWEKSGDGSNWEHDFDLTYTKVE